MAVKIDARGLACPIPVLKTKDALEKEAPKEIVIFVDNEAAKQNVSRFLASKGYSVTTEEKEDEIRIIGILESEACMPSSFVDKEESKKKILILITSDKIGHGDDLLGEKLMQNFINTLKEMEGLWRIVFMNNGVKLTISGSPVLDTLKKLETSGIRLFVCGTCLQHFGLLKNKEVGETTNMLDIVTSLQLADKVIHI
jgi:selenium metabolism protein YedF